MSLQVVGKIVFWGLKVFISWKNFLASFLLWLCSICSILLFIHAFFFCLIRTFASILNFLYVSWLALVFCWSHLDLASFFFFICYLHSSSSHHSFLGVLLCVCITSFAASIIAFFNLSHSSLMIFVSGVFFSLLCNDVLYCLSLLGSCIFVLFHFASWISFFLYMFGNFCFRVIFSK